MLVYGVNGLGDEFLREMSDKQMFEVVRDGFKVSIPSIMDRFRFACREQINDANDEIEEMEKYVDEHPDYVPDGSDEYEYNEMRHIKSHYESVLKWFETNALDLDSIKEKLAEVKQIYGALDQMSRLYLNNLDGHSTFDKSWDEIESRRYEARQRMIAISELNEFIDNGYVLI